MSTCSLLTQSVFRDKKVKVATVADSVLLCTLYGANLVHINAEESHSESYHIYMNFCFTACLS